ncbi:MAG: hypothetical protein PVH39_10850, partial [Syntrophobacterales bacterium]
GILVIVICLVFVICDLEFLVTSADLPIGERGSKSPPSGQPKAGSFPPGILTIGSLIIQLRDQMAVFQGLVESK